MCECVGAHACVCMCVIQGKEMITHYPPLQSKSSPSFLHDRQTLIRSLENWRFCELDVFQKSMICMIFKK